jgi:FMN phosphatase YigB (HAD superfamily)
MPEPPKPEPPKPEPPKPEPPKPEPPKLVVFDAGGVIVRVTGPWEVAHARSGVRVTERIGSPEFAALRVTLADRHQRGELDTPAYAAAVAEASGLQPDEVERILDAWIDDEYPGWAAVIDRLRASGVETALLSNTNAHHWEAMVPGGARAGRYPAIAGLDRHFASHLVGAMKPDAAIFRAVEDATGRHGDEILFFDDLPQNVDGARAHGWRAVQIDPAGDPAAQVLEALEEAGL